MSTYQAAYVEQIGQEARQTPDEYLAALLEIIRLFRQSITLKAAEESLKQGWQEAMQGETIPVSDLWVGVDAE
jgi:hypothetical protein